jgi:hypothetical protein
MHWAKTVPDRRNRQTRFFRNSQSGNSKNTRRYGYNPQRRQVCGELVLKTLFNLAEKCLFLPFHPARIFIG